MAVDWLDKVPPLPCARAVRTPCTWRSPAFAAQLSHGLDQGEDAVHAGVRAGQAAAIGVDGQPAAGRDRAVLDEASALALGAEAQVFQEQDGVDRERVVELQHVDVRRLQAGHRERLRDRIAGRT
jgi:hypothetical protein